MKKSLIISFLVIFTSSCTSLSYWEYKLINKSIDAIGKALSKGKNISNQEIVIPQLPSAPDSLINIAVLDLVANNIDLFEARALSEKLRTELFLTKHYNVREKASIKEILDEQGFQQSGCTTNECLVEIGGIAGVKKIIAGTISRLGNTYSLSVRIINVETALIERLTSLEYSGPIDEILKKGMKKIAIDLIG